ncbi:MAG: PAS domain S-box protein [Bacteroidales bacterium]|jgi:PAS domain S-box-containing protein|nr:PAS domain S-box protein [Bacteroidales bacterium]
MNEVLTVLCLEDSPRDAEILREFLIDAGYDLNMDCTAAEKEFVSFLSNRRYDIILSDFKLPGFDGFGALRWSVEICPDVPFICVSGSIGESLAVELLKKGAVDYVLKDRLERLPSAIQRALDEAKEKKARQQAERQLRIYSETQSKLLHTNDLTEIYRLVAEKISELIGDGIVFTTLLDESSQTLGIVSYKGLNVPFEKLIKTLRIDPTKMVYNLKDITEDELSIYRSGKLEELEGGLYILATRRIPKTLCKIAEKLLQIEHIFTMGFVWQGVHFGGLVILARSDLSIYKVTIELLINQAVTSINRLRAEMKLNTQYALLNALIDSPGDTIIFSLDRNYCYTAFNEKHREEMKKVWNVNIEMGMNLLNCMSSYELRESAKKSIDRALRGESFSEIQCQQELSVFYELSWGPIFQNENITGATVFIRDISERILAEKILNDSELRFRRLFEAARDGILILEAETGLVVNVNQFLVEMLGYSYDQFLGKRIWELGFFKDIVGNHENFEELLQKEYITYDDKPLETIDGSRIEVEFVSYVYKVGNKNVVQCNIRDITQRKLGEIALQNSEEKFSVAFKTSPYAITITQPEDGKFLEVNDAFYSMTGFTREETLNNASVGMNLWVNREDRDFVVRELMAGRKVVGQEFKFKKRNGEIIIGLFSAHLIVIYKNTYILSSINDITERKQAEKVLEESERKLREAQEMAHLGFWNWDIQSGDVIWSEEVFRIFCLDQNEFIPHIDSILALSPWPEDHERDKELINRTIETHNPGSYEQKFLRPDGSIGHYYSTFHGNYDDNGNLTSIVGTVLDITQRKQAEEAIQILNKELEQRVIDRTTQLEAANKELEAFSYSVSHDLRAPLRSIHSYTNILLEEYENKLDDEGKRLCGIISSDAIRMGGLIDDLLNFSRIGRSSLNVSLLDMKSMAVLSFAEIASENEKARTILEIGKLHNVNGDAHLIRLVWNNLISNAIKYSSKKEKSELSIGSQASGNMITYYIKDNGVGFDMLYKHKLFGVFQRLHSGKDFEGNGVGLAIVQRIIQRHGGKVWAEGEVDKGATFYFSLPAEGNR